MAPKKRVSKGVKKIDKLITGVIIGSAIASIFGMSRTKKGKEITQNLKTGTTSVFKKIFNFIGKIVIYVVKLFPKK